MQVLFLCKRVITEVLLILNNHVLVEGTKGSFCACFL